MICMRSRSTWISGIECPFFSTCPAQAQEERRLSHVTERMGVRDNKQILIIYEFDSLPVITRENKRQRCQRNETWITMHTAAMIGDDRRSQEPEERCRSRRSIEGCSVPK
jgi:hypothetical protein